MKCQEKDLEAAAALLLLCRRSPPDQPPSAENRLNASDPHPSSSSLKKPSSFFFPSWGTRSKRSICGCKSKRKREGATCSRPSPATPLDFAGASSDPSTSGSEGFHTYSEIAPSKGLLRSCDSPGQASAVKLSPPVEAVLPTQQPIRGQGRNKALSELQSRERSLKEEKTILLKLDELQLIDSKRKDIEALIAENRKMMNGMRAQQPAVEEAAAARKVSAFALPDLNEPALMGSLEI